MNSKCLTGFLFIGSLIVGFSQLKGIGANEAESSDCRLPMPAKRRLASSMREEPILYSPPGCQIPGVVVPTSADKTESDSGKLASKTRAMRREPPSSLKIPPEREIQGIVVPSSLWAETRQR